MVLPIKGKYKVTSHFRSKARPSHTGTDLISDDRNIYAVENGRAELRYDPISGYGINLYVGSIKFEYLHLYKTRVAGYVKKGQKIGKWGGSGTVGVVRNGRLVSSGRKLSPHLHFAAQKPYNGPQFDAWRYVVARLDDMKTTREDSIWLWRTVRFKHSPNEIEKRAWTGKDLVKILQTEYGYANFLKRKKAVQNYDKLLVEKTELVKENTLLREELKTLKSDPKDLERRVGVIEAFINSIKHLFNK